MRHVFLMIFLTTALILMVRCGGNETLSSFDGKMVVVVAPVTKSYAYLPYLYTIQSDSIKWLYDCVSEKESRVSILTKGKIRTDSLLIDENGSITDTIPVGIGTNHLTLGVESFTGEVSSSVQIDIDINGTFMDTIQVTSSSISELILPQNSRLFLAVDIFVSDTIPLINPHSSKR